MNYKLKIGLLILVILTMLLAGCENDDSDRNKTAITTSSTSKESIESTDTPKPTVDATKFIIEPTETPATEGSPIPAATAVTKDVGLQMTVIQRNSITMLNYLAGLTEEINASRNSRLYLENAYSTLLNNTHPNAVDVKTQSQLSFLLDTLNNYRMIAVKRDRLQFIYEQNQAQAIRDAVPNPLGLLSAVSSLDWKKAVASIVYMAVDSYTSYETSTAQADMQFIQDRWELDDEEQKVLNNINIETFGYLNSTVREIGLQGDDALLALTPDNVTNFVKWKNLTNISQRIRYLETYQNKYKAYGEYWLLLAESYYNHGDYSKCLEAVTAYESLDMSIFREDHGYAKVLPLAIIAAAETYSDEEYIHTAERYANAILNNTLNNQEWSLRYFSAQTYIDLYSKTKNTQYLSKAFEIALDNVTWLVGNQKSQNSLFLADIIEQTIPKDATEAEKKEIENYNLQLKEDRKLELPPIYEPLLLNCELLFALADEIEIDDATKANIEEILHEDSAPIFLIPELNKKYSFSSKSDDAENVSSKVEFNGKELIIPAKIISCNPSIKVKVLTIYSDEPIVFDDWLLVRVDRPEKNNLDTFSATFKSAEAEKYNYGLDASIQIEIQAKQGINTDIVLFEFLTVNTKTDFFSQIAFWNSSIGFQRIK